MKAKALKTLSHISKATIASTGISILGYSTNVMEKGQYELGLGLALAGIACLTLFVYLIEKQSSDAAVEKVKALKN